MCNSRNRVSMAINGNFVQFGLIIFLLFCLPKLTYPTCSLPDTIKTDTTITGTCTLVKDLFINRGVILTITPPCTLSMTALSDSKNLGLETQRIEILVAGELRVIGDSSPNGAVVFRSDSGRAGDWYGIRSADSSAKVFVQYATLSDGDIAIRFPYPLPTVAPCSIQYSLFERWRNHAIANTFENDSLGGTLEPSSLSETPDNLLIQGNTFLGSDEAVRFTHYFGVVVDSNKFLNQENLSVYFDDYTGTITQNYFFADNSNVAIRARGSKTLGDSTTIAKNVIEGYYSYAQIAAGDVFSSPQQGFRITDNKFITGQGTESSPFGLKTEIVGIGGADYKLVARNNIFLQMDTAAIFSFSAFQSLVGDDLGDSAAGSPGNNAFLLPCNSYAKAIKRVGGQTIPAEGNWFGTSTPDSSSLFEGPIDFRPFLAVPPTPVSGDICRNSTWGPGEINVNGDVRIKSGTTLTIEAGTTIRLQSNYDNEKAGVDTAKCEIIVESGGKVVINGASGNPALFLSSRAEAQAGKDDWQGIKVEEGGFVSISHTVIRHAVTGIEDNSEYSHSIQNVRIGKCKSYGIRAQDTDSLIIRGCRVDSVNNYPSAGGTGIYTNSSSYIGPKLVKDTVIACYTGLSIGHNTAPVDTCIVLGDSTGGLVSNTGIFNWLQGYSGDTTRTLPISNTVVGGYFSLAHISNYSDGRLNISTCQLYTNEGTPRSPVGIQNDGGDFLKVRNSSIHHWGTYGVLTDHGSGVPDLGVYSGDNGYNDLYTGIGGSSWKFVYDEDCGGCSTPVIKAEYNQWYTTPSSSRFSPNVDRIPYITPIPWEKLVADEGQKKENLPRRTELFQNYPNPFNPTTLIQFNLVKPERVSLEVFNILGQKVRTMLSGEEFAAGPYTFLWDGKDDKGRGLSSGMYFYRLQTSSYSKTMKMSLLK